MRNFRGGFTLIETLIAAAVLVIFFTAAALIVQTSIEAIGNAKLRGEATRIAQERLELTRNLAYEDIGTIGGVPAGQLTPVEVVSVGGIDFNIETSVLYVDDAFDGLAPTDLLPVDYKRVRIAVTWAGMFASKRPLVLLTDVAPKGMELADDTGTISVLVFNAQGIPVSEANVHIEAALTPAVDMNVTTDDNGRVLIPGAPICDACYKISASKTGYSSDRTYGNNEVAHPTKPHLSVLEGSVSEVSFAIDVPATMVLRVTRDKTSNYSVFPGVQIVVKGTKEIGRTVADDPVYKVERTVTTGLGGLVSVTDLEWDSYTLTVPIASTVDFAGSWPFLPIAITPGSTTNVTAIVKAASLHTLLIQMTNEERSPLGSATAQITTGGIIATQAAGLAGYGDWSQVHFSNLTETEYDVTIESLGYATISGVISVSGETLEYFMLSTESATPLP